MTGWPAGTFPVSARYWRMMFADWADDPLTPARSAEGRSHYAGQPALYLSETPEGCVVASRRYMSEGDPPRVLVPLWVEGGPIVDLRDHAVIERLGIDTTHRAAEWQLIRAEGRRSPTWDISDRVRALGLAGMIYASRSQPDLAHMTLFSWNRPGAPIAAPDGSPIRWP